MKVISVNKKALFNYTIISKLEVGLVLFGWEVKSIKSGMCSFESSYVHVLGGHLQLFDFYIKPWKYSSNVSVELEKRKRTLLAKEKEILSLQQEAKKNRLTIVPIDIYINNNGLIKMTVGLVKGKKLIDKRLLIKEREQKREIARFKAQ